MTKRAFKMFYSTDWHWTMRSPESRVDNFAHALEGKIRTFFRMGADLGCDCYAVNGDFVDSAFLTPSSVIRLGSIIREELRLSKKKLYYTLGNHDVIAYNPESINSTAFGVFLQFLDEDMIHLTRAPCEVHTAGFPVRLSGINSYSMIDKHVYVRDTDEILLPRSRDWVVQDNQGFPWIHMAHGFLSPKPILEGIPHTVISEMRHTQATVTLGGHEHGGFPITKLDNGLAFNVGSLGRVFATLSEMQRMPKYAMVTIYPDGSPDITIYDCPVAAPGHAIMDRSKLDERKAKEAFLAQVRGSAQDVMDNINIDAVDFRVIMFRYKATVRPAVYQEAERRLNL